MLLSNEHYRNVHFVHFKLKPVQVTCSRRLYQIFVRNLCNTYHKYFYRQVDLQQNSQFSHVQYPCHSGR